MTKLEEIRRELVTAREALERAAEAAADDTDNGEPGGEEPGGEEPGGEEPGGDGWAYSLDNLPGGPVKADAIKGKTFSDTNWMKVADKDYVDCTFTGEALHSDTIAKNVRLINPTFKGLKPFNTGGSSDATFGFYINLGKKGELRHGFVIFGGKVIGLKANEFGEFKAFDPTIIGLNLTESPGIQRGFRVRHGAFALIAHCKGLKRVTLRGHHHAVFDCPGTQVDFLAGDLDGQFKDWIKDRPAGEGQPRKGSYQRAEFCFAAGVGGVGVGAQMQSNTPKKAFRCMVAPGQKYELLQQEGCTIVEIGSFKELSETW